MRQRAPVKTFHCLPLPAACCCSFVLIGSPDPPAPARGGNRFVSSNRSTAALRSSLYWRFQPFCQFVIRVEVSQRMTLSALAKTFGGTVNPICWAVFKLTTISNLVGCSTGISDGFAPLRILSNWAAARRVTSARMKSLGYSSLRSRRLADILSA